jgi:hypothetical protein
MFACRWNQLLRRKERLGTRLPSRRHSVQQHVRGTPCIPTLFLALPAPLARTAQPTRARAGLRRIPRGVGGGILPSVYTYPGAA